MMNVQEKYWKELIQLKFQQLYFEEYLGESYKTNNIINIITAVTSSISIAGWAIWSEFGYIWSIIIVVSQLSNAVKIFLPFSTRIKALTKAYSDSSDLFLKAEYYWYRVANGDLTSVEINNLHYQLKCDNQVINNKYNLQVHLPFKSKLKDIADASVNEYFIEN